MRFARIWTPGGEALCLETRQGELVGRMADDPAYPGGLGGLIRQGPETLAHAEAILGGGRVFDPAEIEWLPPIDDAGKIICVGLNYLDHAQEAGFAKPAAPEIFARFNSSLIGHDQPVIKPAVSNMLDYEGEMVAIIGKGGRAIPAASALDHVVGYSVFNDVSVRDFQLRTTQWTLGKNFDGTGAFGPIFVTENELPQGAAGLRIETRVNGEVMQSASTDDMIFDVAALVAMVSEAMTLEPGDVIVTGTPAGVGAARTPPVWLAQGDICEVEVEGIGTLRNTVASG